MSESCSSRLVLYNGVVVRLAVVRISPCAGCASGLGVVSPCHTLSKMTAMV
jgi:hypothetical protein